MKNKAYNKVALASAAITLALVPIASAVVDPAIDTMITDSTTVFTTIKALVLSVVGFFIVLGFVKLVKRAR